MAASSPSSPPEPRGPAPVPAPGWAGTLPPSVRALLVELREASERMVRALRWAIAVLLVVGGGAWIARGANLPRDPYLAATPAETAPCAGELLDPAPRVPPFGEARVAVHPPEGGPTELCVLVADEAAERRQGLMDRDDLRGYDGMLFAFDESVEQAFWMRKTRIPLSIAFFAADGRFVSAADMEPCGDHGDCPRYAPAGHYRYALEVPRGALPELGVGPGSTLEVAATAGQ